MNQTEKLQNDSRKPNYTSSNEFFEDRDYSVKIGVTDLDGVLRGKYISTEKARSAINGTLGFCDVVFGWDVTDTPFTNTKQTGWHTGFPDALVRLDPQTIRRVPWDNKIPFLIGEFFKDDGLPHPLCPRQVLRKILNHAEKSSFSVLCGMEFEWFNFLETPQSWSEKQGINPTPITPGMFGYSLLRAQANGEFINAILSEMQAFKVPIEGLHTETGPGVYEAALVYSDALEAADRAVLFKSGVKEIAQRFKILPSFMAKWNSSLPGCSGHIHQSILHEGKNIFHDSQQRYSPILKSYVAGQLKYMRDFSPLYWPNVNSYKRLVDGFWAPVSAIWGIDDRTTSIRIIPGTAWSTRVETRCPGADANPYLSIAAAIASGLQGIEEGLKLDAPGNLGKTNNEMNPRTLLDAADQMQRSKIARLWLGDQFVEHFCSTRYWEYEQSLMAVTDWERKRYMEII